MSQTVVSLFAMRDRVYIDGCNGLVGVVTAITWRAQDVINYEVSWVVGGKAESSIIESWRLTSADAL